MCYFFFQAEDGIRDSSVTGVQTCALPISPRACLSASYRRNTSRREGSWIATAPSGAASFSTLWGNGSALPATQGMDLILQRLGEDLVRWIWRCFLSAPTSRAGS